MNQESLDRANAFLAAVVARVQPGDVLDATPADIAKDMGMPEPLAAARAVRALLARRRLEVTDGKYRLLDARPIEAGEREQVPRPRRPRQPKEPRAEPPGPSSRPRAAFSSFICPTRRACPSWRWGRGRTCASR